MSTPHHVERLVQGPLRFALTSVQGVLSTTPYNASTRVGKQEIVYPGLHASIVSAFPGEDVDNFHLDDNITQAVIADCQHCPRLRNLMLGGGRVDEDDRTLLSFLGNLECTLCVNSPSYAVRYISRCDFPRVTAK